jgi:hypothetical protein
VDVVSTIGTRRVARPIGHIGFELRGSVPVYADDPYATEIPSMSSDDLAELIEAQDYLDAEIVDHWWEPS